MEKCNGAGKGKGSPLLNGSPSPPFQQQEPLPLQQYQPPLLEQEQPPPPLQHDLETTNDNEAKIQLDSNVVIMMDSNVNFIHLNKVWNRTSKIKTGKSNLLLEEVNNHDFSKVKMVIIGTGTNETTEETAENIFQNLVNGGSEILKNYPKVKVCIAQIPPRKFSDNAVTCQLNKMIKENLPTTLHSLLYENLTIEHMHDDKHISKRFLGTIFVQNMRDKIAELIGNRRQQSRNGRSTYGRSTNNIDHGKSTMSGSTHANTNNDIANLIVSRVLDAMEQSQTSLKDQLKFILHGQ